jgi:hypothetical protein
MTGPIANVVIVLVVVLGSLLGLVLVRRLVPRELLVSHTDIAGYVYAVIGVLYAVILAQVVIAAWEEYRDARLVAAAEADAVLNLSRLTRGLPSADRTTVDEALRDYARRVVDVEWPAMARGDFAPSVDHQLVHQLWRAVDEAGRQVGAGDRPSYAAALDQLDALNEARRNRVLLGESALPEMMTLTLVLGAVITIGFSYLFAVEDRRVHGLMTASLAILVALLLLLEFQLETPYQGISAIGPTAMELVLGEIDAGMGDMGTAP